MRSDTLANVALREGLLFPGIVVLVCAALFVASAVVFLWCAPDLITWPDDEFNDL